MWCESVAVFHVGEVFQLEEALGLGDAAGGERGGRPFRRRCSRRRSSSSSSFSSGRGDDLLQAGDEVSAGVQLGGLVALTGDDERRARLVDEDGVHLVHDGEGVAALHHVAL